MQQEEVASIADTTCSSCCNFNIVFMCWHLELDT